MSSYPLEARLAHLEGAFDQVSERLNGLERRLDILGQTLKHRFNWVIGTVVGTWVTTMLAVLFHH